MAVRPKNVFLPEEAVEHMRYVYEILSHAATHYTNDKAYVQKTPDGKEESITFGDLKAHVDALRAGLSARSIAGQHMAVIGETCIEWVEAYLALISGGGVCVPIDKALAHETMAMQLRHADVETVFVSLRYLAKLEAVIGDCPSIKNVIIMRGTQDDAATLGERTISFDDLITEGRHVLEHTPLPSLEDSVDPEDMCVIIFTSGTTGPNKGVMLNNRCIMGTLRGCAWLLHYPRSSFSVLPINHSYELNAHLMSSLYCGTCVYINDDLRKIIKNLKMYQPEMSCMVPMMLDLIVRKLKHEISKSGKEKSFCRLVKLSNFLRKMGIDARRKLFGQVLEPLGGKLQFIICGGAALNQETIDFLSDIGIQIYNGYGITECSPVAAVNGHRLTKAHSVGRILPTAEARISNADEDGNGEIEFRGDFVMPGYYKAPEDTARVFTEDGWFRTGDIGYKDEDEYLYITGRLKNVIILPNGENVYPEELESEMQRQMPYISEIVIAENSRNNGLYAYIHPDAEMLKGNGLETAEHIKAFIRPNIETFNRSQPAYKRIADFEISMEEFEKNTAHKILRHKVINK